MTQELWLKTKHWKALIGLERSINAYMVSPTSYRLGYEALGVVKVGGMALVGGIIWMGGSGVL